MYLIIRDINEFNFSWKNFRIRKSRKYSSKIRAIFKRNDSVYSAGTRVDRLLMRLECSSF